MTLSEAFLHDPEFKDKLEDLIINGDPETMTARSLRTQLEKHFKFEKDSLKAKPYKAITNTMIDEQLQKLSTSGFSEKDTKDSQAVKEEVQVSTKKKGLKNKHTNSEEEDEKMDDKNEVSEEEEEIVKKPKKRIVESEDEEMDEGMDEKTSLKNKVSDSSDDSDHKSKKPKSKTIIKKEGKKKSSKHIVDTSDEEEEEIPKRRATKKRVIPDSSEDEETKHSQKKVKKSKKVDSKDKGKGKVRVVIENCDDESEPESESEEPKSVKRGLSKSKAPSRPEGTKKEEDTVKKLRKYISKCGIIFISIAKKVSECQSVKEEIDLLNKVLYDAGLRGTPTVEKLAAIKHKRAIQKEIEGLDTSLIIDSGDRRATRTRQRNTKPTYTVVAESSEEEEGEEEDEEEEESESEDGYSQDEDEPTKTKKYSEEDDD